MAGGTSSQGHEHPRETNWETSSLGGRRSRPGPRCSRCEEEEGRGRRVDPGQAGAGPPRHPAATQEDAPVPGVTAPQALLVNKAAWEKGVN